MSLATAKRLVLALVVVTLAWLLFVLSTNEKASGGSAHTVFIPMVRGNTPLVLGSATHDKFLYDSAYVNVIKDFDVLVPEVVGNYYYVLEKGWASFETILAFADLYDIEVHYSTVFWWWFPVQPPDPMAWLEEVLTRYPQIVNWIIVNEGYYYSQPTLPYIEQAYAYAREIRPDAVLWYNGILITSEEQAAVMRLVELGLVDGVGVECHLNIDSDLSRYSRFLSWMQARGTAWRVSELDVSFYEYTPEQLQAQAKKFQEVVEMLRIYGGQSITFWEFTDKYSWLRESGYYPTPFDIYILPKPAWDVFGTNHSW